MSSSAKIMNMITDTKYYKAELNDFMDEQCQQ